MQDANPNEFSQQARKQLMKSIIDFDSLVYWKQDILLTDLSLRNVMIPNKSCKADCSTEIPARFLDFGDALFNRRRDDPGLAKINLFMGQYISPILRWSGWSRKGEFKAWIDWDWEAWIKAEYAHTASTITPEMCSLFS
jgi:hypothetical protein